MWLHTKYGFLSVISARQGDGSFGQAVDPNRLMVRARDRRHLTALQQRFPELIGGCDIREFAHSDYPCRIFVDKAVWSKVLVALNDEIDYDNFKSEVARFQGQEGADYEHALHEVWAVMRRLD